MTTKSAICFLLLGASVALGAERDAAKFSDHAAQSAKLLSDRIKTELRGLTNHPWAGDYYRGDVYDTITLVLAPEAGYVFEWHGCLGVYDRNYGLVTTTNGAIRLSVTFPNPGKGFEKMAQELIPVPWGDRRYLIPTDDVIGFCNCVNDGFEPRTCGAGFHLLRRGDEKKSVSGFPSVPADYRAYLLTTPINAVITGIGSATTRPSVC